MCKIYIPDAGAISCLPEILKLMSAGEMMAIPMSLIEVAELEAMMNPDALKPFSQVCRKLLGAITEAFDTANGSDSAGGYLNGINIELVKISQHEEDLRLQIPLDIKSPTGKGTELYARMCLFSAARKMATGLDPTDGDEKTMGWQDYKSFRQVVIVTKSAKTALYALSQGFNIWLYDQTKFEDLEWNRHKG